MIFKNTPPDSLPADGMIQKERDRQLVPQRVIQRRAEPRAAPSSHPSAAANPFSVRISMRTGTVGSPSGCDESFAASFLIARRAGGSRTTGLIRVRRRRRQRRAGSDFAFLRRQLFKRRLQLRQRHVHQPRNLRQQQPPPHRINAYCRALPTVSFAIVAATNRRYVVIASCRAESESVA